MLAAQPAVAQQSPLVGGWGGALEVQSIRLRLTLAVADSGGALHARFTSVDQGGAAVPVTVETRADSVIFTAAPLSASFRAVLAGRDTLRGTWAQGPATLPLTMVRGADAGMVLRRPQHPQPPFPYRSEEVTVESVPGVRLAGTLTLPQGDGPVPAVVLVSGSGAQDRDETLMGHKPFLVLSDHLTRAGIAVLRLDDRGTARSTGSFAASTSADFAEDAAAAVRWLRARPEVADDGVGIVGHSEGGSDRPDRGIATPRGGVRRAAGGPRHPLRGADGKAGRAHQPRGRRPGARGGADGRPFSVRCSPPSRRRRTARRCTRGSARSASAFGRRSRRAARAAGRVRRHVEAAVNTMVSPWYRWFLRYDPAPALRATRVPVLALNGGLDLQVPADEPGRHPAVAARRRQPRRHDREASGAEPPVPDRPHGRPVGVRGDRGDDVAGGAAAGGGVDPGAVRAAAETAGNRE